MWIKRGKVIISCNKCVSITCQIKWLGLVTLSNAVLHFLVIYKHWLKVCLIFVSRMHLKVITEAIDEYVIMASKFLLLPGLQCIYFKRGPSCFSYRHHIFPQNCASSTTREWYLKVLCMMLLHFLSCRYTIDIQRTIYPYFPKLLHCHQRNCTVDRYSIFVNS